jgi:hypothetical protein
VKNDENQCNNYLYMTFMIKKIEKSMKFFGENSRRASKFPLEFQKYWCFRANLLPGSLKLQLTTIFG